MSRTDLPSALRHLLSALERRLFVVLAFYGIGRFLLKLCALVLGLYLLDRLLDPPRAVRLILDLGAIGVLLWQALGDLIHPLRRRPLARDLAAIWERKAPQFHDRLATAIELAEDPRESSVELLAEVTKEAVTLSDGLDARKVVPTGRARRSMFSGTAAAAVLLLGIWAYPNEAAIFLQRALGSATPWPSDTRLVLMPAYLEGTAAPVDFEVLGPESYALSVARGTVISLRVRAEGVFPQRIQAIGLEHSRPMHDLGGGNFVLRLPPLRQDQDFHFRGGDDTDGLPRLSIRVGDAPGVGEWLVRTTPPAYTRLPEEQGNFHEVRLLRGSLVNIRMRPDRDTAKVETSRLDGSREVLTADTDGYYTVEFPITGSGEILFALTGVDGFRQDRASMLKWTATPDRRPEPRILFPAERWVSVPGGKIPLAFTVQDDFGLGELQLTGRGEERIPLAFRSGALRFDEVLRLEAPENFSVESFEDNRFRFRLEATDEAQPDSNQALVLSPWIEILPAAVEEQRLAERIVRLRERIEGMRDAAGSFASPGQAPSNRRVRRLLKSIDAALGDSESFLLERLYSGLDGQTAALLPTVEKHLLQGLPDPGVLTDALLASHLQGPEDRSAMLLDLCRALHHARTGPGTALLLAANEDLPIQAAAGELQAQLDEILQILLSWEDFNSAVNLLRSLLERQRGLYLRTQEASER